MEQPSVENSIDFRRFENLQSVHKMAQGTSPKKYFWIGLIISIPYFILRQLEFEPITNFIANIDASYFIVFDFFSFQKKGRLDCVISILILLIYLPLFLDMVNENRRYIKFRHSIVVCTICSVASYSFLVCIVRPDLFGDIYSAFLTVFLFQFVLYNKAFKIKIDPIRSIRVFIKICTINISWFFIGIIHKIKKNI